MNRLIDKFKNRALAKRLIANTGWLFFEKMLRFAAGIFIGAWVARYLGPSQFGIYSYAIAFAGLFGGIAALGLDGVVVRELIHDPDEEQKILGSAFILKVLSGILTFALILFVIHLVPNRNKALVWMTGIIAGSLCFKAFDVIDFWFQSQVRSKYAVWAKNSAFLLMALLKVIMILKRAPLILFAWTVFGEIVVIAIGLVVFYTITGKHIGIWRISLKWITRLLGESWPLIFSGTFVLINMQVDKIMVGAIAGYSEVGLYSAACRLSEVWYFIPVAVGSSVAPIFAKTVRQNIEEYRIKLQKTYNIMSFSAIVLAVATTILSSTIIRGLYGADYSASAHMLTIHIWSTLFIFHVSIRSRALIAEGKQRIVALYALLTVISNIALNLILIPRYGGVGAAYASLISWTMCVLLWPCIFRTVSVSTKMFIKSLYGWFGERVMQ